jgi:hypothetical protein
MYSQAEAHLANLDRCGGRSLRRAYLVLLIAAERAGLEAVPRDAIRELMIRDPAGSQPFSVGVDIDALTFTLRRPSLAENPELAAQAAARFGARMRGGTDGMSEVRIRIGNEQDAEDIVDWLFPNGNFSLGYEGRRSA